MYHRSHEEVEGSCFIIFEERHATAGSRDNLRQDRSLNHFVQFSFEEKSFCLDMPRQTLSRAEAEQILRSRQGFFYLRNRPEFTLKGEDVEGYNPFRKVYAYGDERSAAEDMAFIFYQVWRFPVHWQFFVTAGAFGDKETDWESGTPMDRQTTEGQGAQKPTLTLVAPPFTAQKLAALYKKLTGRNPTTEEMERLRQRLAAMQRQPPTGPKPAKEEGKEE
jgi:hypothetical protein